MDIRFGSSSVLLLLTFLAGCLSQSEKKTELKVDYDYENKVVRYIYKIESAVKKLLLTEKEANEIHAKLRKLYDSYYDDSSSKVCIRDARLTYKTAILQELGCVKFYYDEYAYSSEVPSLDNDLLAIYESIINGVDQTVSLCEERMEEAYINDGDGVHASLRRKAFMSAAVQLKAKNACKKYNSNYFADAATTVMQETSFPNAVIYLNRKWTTEMDNAYCTRQFITYFKELKGLGTFKAGKAIRETQKNHSDCE